MTNTSLGTAGPPELTLVAALTHDRVIGADGGIPWHLPEDFRHFKRLTMGGTLIMGRATFDSIGRALPGRRTIVVTRSPDWRATDVETAPNFEAAVRLAADGPGEGAVYIAGGAQIYTLALPRAHHMVLTHVDLDVPGDTYFPEWDATQWRVVERTAYDGFTVVTYDRVASPAPTAG